MKKRAVKKIFLLMLFMFVSYHTVGHAEPIGVDLNLSVGGQQAPSEYVGNIKLLLLLTFLTFIPAIVLLTTSFTRIVIVFGFTRTALSTQQSPPNQVIIALALFMSLFIMTPVYKEVNSNAIQPYVEGKLSYSQAIEIGSKPVKNFMLNQTREKDLALFYKVAEYEKPKDRYDVPFTVLIPAFAISEIKTAFQMGFLIFVPFIVIDMIVASILMSMGMFMLPPVTVSLPFKILLFILADGWHLVVKSLLESFVR
ncbi:flagellar type III secretion system pore protein FliP [Clostridium cylindrosporum]|uniref:Flagellar biosynthetic protein FliP n=1 Tax=Clostridium cylindrosporum DSM 605 TaxID=1121307 RepID=A0A0J8G1T4_CLOCY|nr:flagellar type III secretion system pore protein FliP [Clostridium cylindrosporum]KMT21711.1 flagellar biosynthetic protein FliP [Clostridium cylindrosporum DSM 605]